MSGLPTYDDAVGPSSGAAPPAHFQAGSNNYLSASDEKKQQQQQQQQQQYAAPPAHGHHGSSGAGAKVLKIWHAASGNSLLTAADEQTPIYNVIDSRAPDEQEQRHQSDKMHAEYQQQQQQHGSGVTRRDPHSQEAPADVAFARQVAHSRANPALAQPHKFAELWLLQVRRGGDRNGPVLATIKRHVNTKSAVGIELEGMKTGIEQHSGFPHTKYIFKWRGKVYNWQKTHKAPGTSRLDSGNFICRDEQKTVYAYSTSEDSRCDGSLQFEDRAIDEGLLDIMTITGFIMRDIDDERNNPSYMTAPYGACYGPYANPYYAAGYGFYPSPMIGMGFPLLL